MAPRTQPFPKRTRARALSLMALIRVAGPSAEADGLVEMLLMPGWPPCRPAAETRLSLLQPTISARLGVADSARADSLPQADARAEANPLGELVLAVLRVLRARGHEGLEPSWALTALLMGTQLAEGALSLEMQFEMRRSLVAYRAMVPTLSTLQLQPHAPILLQTAAECALHPSVGSIALLHEALLGVHAMLQAHRADGDMLESVAKSHAVCELLAEIYNRVSLLLCSGEPCDHMHARSP